MEGEGRRACDKNELCTCLFTCSDQVVRAGSCRLGIQRGDTLQEHNRSGVQARTNLFPSSSLLLLSSPSQSTGGLSEMAFGLLSQWDEGARGTSRVSSPATACLSAAAASEEGAVCWGCVLGNGHPITSTDPKGKNLLAFHPKEQW